MPTSVAPDGAVVCSLFHKQICQHSHLFLVGLDFAGFACGSTVDNLSTVEPQFVNSLFPGISIPIYLACLLENRNKTLLLIQEVLFQLAARVEVNLLH